ncbi:MAG: (2Fe-2S)-binding protein [Elusimicrobia bacterium]|nr:(2Fe-2S)-binding protein [Elusimicrobiota bacterium]
MKMKKNKFNKIFSLKCIVNGEKIERDIDSSLTLLGFLRNDLNLKGTKEGCGDGECGACMALVSGKAVNSCIMMAVQAHGKSVITIEGLKDKNKLHHIKKSFIDEGAVQCGFCTPGMIISAQALLKTKPKANIKDIKEALSGNICRCTGYEKIIGAVKKCAKG